jgi:GDP-L-fucose synthase
VNLDSKIVITGASGKVGRRLLEVLKGAGYSKIYDLGRKEVDFLDGDAVLEKISEIAPTHIFMLAAKVGGIQDNLRYPAEYLVENLKIQINLFEAVRKTMPLKCIFASSSAAYPIDSPNPKKEDMFIPGRVEASNEGYVIAKIVGMKLAEFYFKQYALVTTTALIANIYGTHDNYDLGKAHVISSLIKKIADAKSLGLDTVHLLGTGNARREFVHVDDVVNGLIFLMKDKIQCEIINLGTGEDITIKDLANLIAKKLDFKGDFQWDGAKSEGVSQRLCNISKLKERGFEPKINLDLGLDRTIQEYIKIHQQSNPRIS